MISKTEEIFAGREDKFPCLMDLALMAMRKLKKDGKLHPTQKPVALLEYLIKTYTNEGDVVLDPFLGSASTCVAAVNTNRHYIGFELDPQYFQIACDRLDEVERRVNV